MSLTKEVKEFSFVIEPEDSDSYLESSVYVIASNHANVTSYSDKDTNTVRSIDVITDKSSAFLNNQNYNIVRYFNSSLAKYDGFKVFAVKIVLLSSASYLVPRVEEYRAIAVSA